jgi:hypothetical protein
LDQVGAHEDDDENPVGMHLFTIKKDFLLQEVFRILIRYRKI